jgi:uncharacterized protein YecA (UPF0149 family)
MTFAEYTSNPSSYKTPIGIGQSTTYDAHDGDDDELQRFSKRVAALFVEMRDGAMDREQWERKCDKERRCSRPAQPLGASIHPHTSSSQ